MKYVLSAVRKERRQKFLDLLGGKCNKCGTTRNLHFDHLKPQRKEFTIGDTLDIDDDTLTKEVKKCQLLCADCHHLKTLDNQEYGKPSEHGTLWRYKHYKCRCKKCRQAMSDYYHQRLGHISVELSSICK